MFEKKKLTKKQIQQKYEDLKIDSHRRITDLNQRVREAELGAAQVNQAVDAILGAVAEKYGMFDGTSYKLYLPKTGDKKYRLETRVWVEDEAKGPKGLVVTATEVKDEEVQEHKD